MAMGFKKNRKDACVFNRREADGSQTTLILHVDDMMVTAKNEAKVDKFMVELGTKYSDLTISRGRIHDYLGMNMSWEKKGKVIVTMPGYINDVLEFAVSMKGTATTPAGANLFEIDALSPKLSTEDKDFFHSLTAKILYLCKRSRPDVLLAVSFLVRRVREPTQQDLKKLKRCVQYLRGTADIGMCLEPSKQLTVYGWIDASFAVHNDMKSHTGALVGIGKGPFWAKSSVQKLNTTSSTEAELVAVSEAAGQLLWTREFMLEQQYKIEGDSELMARLDNDIMGLERDNNDAGNKAILYQDNQSTIALLNRGEAASSRTRHIAIRYFYLSDKIIRGEVAMEYLPTDQMTADILTKPLQGQQFINLRNELLNWYV
jgi:ribonuclease HI